MPDERWLPVVGFEGWYEVSDQGRVRSLARTIMRKDGKKYKVKPHILTPNLNGSRKRNRQHVEVLLSGPNGSQVHARIHTLVLTAFVGPRPPGMECRHLNGNAKNNWLINLIWGTAKENSDDSERHGTRVHGSRKHNAKLQETDIPTIRAARASGVKLSAIATQYGVEPQTISRVARQTGWTHVPAGDGQHAPDKLVNRAKLQESDILVIRAARAAGVKLRVLALQYGVTETTISDLVLGRTWRHIPMTVTNHDLFEDERT
jgi:hypothetical protein